MTACLETLDQPKCPASDPVTVIRPTTPADAPRIAALLAASGLHPSAPPQELHWKYWLERPEWNAPRSYVLIHDHEILGHAGIVPGGCVWAGGRQQTIHLTDWAARPEAPGAGVALLKHIRQRFQALLVSIGGSALTLRILPEIGFRSAGKVTRLALPLRAGRILVSGGGPGWKRLARAARARLWIGLRASLAAGGFSTQRIYASDIGALASYLPVARPGTAIFERSVSLLAYALACPTTPSELYAWQGHSGARGYFLLAFAPEQARLVDWWVASTDPADCRGLLRAAAQQAYRQTEVAELVTWASEPGSRLLSAECGFHARGAHPIQVLPRAGTSLPGGTLRVQMLDNDAAFVHHGQPELWL